MPSDDIYAKCNFTRSGMPEIHFEVIIKVPKSTFEALRQDPRTKNLSDTQVFSNDVARWALPEVYPVGGAEFSTGCNFYPEGEVPPETKERAANGQINELTFWVI
jgi:hypothetical protein